jgi:hypothetical protein
MEKTKKDAEKQRFRQLKLAPAPDPEELKKQKQRQMVNANKHLKESLRLLLESLDQNSIEFQRVLAYIIRAMRRMEKKGIFHMKTMPNKENRIYKKVYCCNGLEAWKKCPEYYCRIWPCNEDSECPHDRIDNEGLSVLDNIK